MSEGVLHEVESKHGPSKTKGSGPPKIIPKAWPTRPAAGTRWVILQKPNGQLNIYVYTIGNINFMPMVPIHFVQLSAGNFDTKSGSDAVGLAKTFSEIAAEQPRSFVIHFHGGLVSRESGLASANMLSPEYKKAGAESLFVVWETSATEVVGQEIQRIFDEPIFQSILVRTTEFVKGKLEKTLGPAGGRGISELPRTLASEVQDRLDKGKRGEAMFADIEITDPSSTAALVSKQALTEQEATYIKTEINEDDDIKRHVRSVVSVQAEQGGRDIGTTRRETTLMDPEVLAEDLPTVQTPADEKARSILGVIALGKRVVTVVGAVIWRYANGRDHGPYLTIMEEIMRAFYVRAAGRFLWTEMKDAVGRAFEPDPNRGGTALVEQMRRLWQGGVHPCVTLVGHSAGAIYVGRMLKQFEKSMPADFRVNVVLIAPACTFDYLEDSLRQAGTRVANLRIFGMSDAVELQDHLVPLVYPASLLYFVSGVLEDDRDQPLAGMQRYYSQQYDGANFQTIAAVKAFNCLVRPHAYAWAQTGGFDGANCDMVTHGGWAGSPSTLMSVLSLIRKGSLNAW